MKLQKNYYYDNISPKLNLCEINKQQSIHIEWMIGIWINSAETNCDFITLIQLYNVFK